MRRDQKYIAKHAELAKDLERPAPVAQKQRNSHAEARRRADGHRSKGSAAPRGKPVYRAATNFILPKNYVSAEQLRAEFQRALGLEVATQPEQKPEREIRNYWND